MPLESAGGASALLVVGPDLAAKLPQTPVWLLGAGERITHKTITYAPSLTDTAIQASAARAFAQAGRFIDALDYARAALCGFETFGPRAAGDIQEAQRLIVEIEASMRR